MAAVKKQLALRVGIITDIHFMCHDNPARDFKAYIRDLNHCQPPLDLMLNLGDMGREGYVEDIRAYMRQIKHLRIPVYHTLGNHDAPVWQNHSRKIREILGAPRKSFALGGIRFLLMPGFEKEVNLAWLSRQLRKTGKGKRIVVGGHHPASPEEAALMNRHGVEVYLFGHRHVNRDYRLKGLRCLGTSNSFLGGKVGEAEGFRIIEFNQDGFTTEYRWAEIHDYHRIIRNSRTETGREIMLCTYDTADPVSRITMADGTDFDKCSALTWKGACSNAGPENLKLTNLSGRQRHVKVGRAAPACRPTVKGRGTWLGLAGSGTPVSPLPLERKPVPAWTAFSAGTPNVQALNLKQGRLYCPAGAAGIADESRLTCLDAASGNILWQCRLSSAIRGSCALGREHVYIHGVMGTLHALDLVTGRQAWKLKYSGRIHGWFYTTPTYHGGVVYGGTNADFRAVEAASGQTLWQYRGEGTDWNVTSSKPLIIRQSVIMGMGPRGVVCLRKKDGRMRWHVGAAKEYGSVGMPVTTDGVNVYFATDKWYILAVSLRTGKVEWSWRQKGTSMLASPLPCGKDELLVADLRGRIYRLHGPSGQIIWQRKLPRPVINTSCYTRGWGSVLSTPARVDQFLIVGGADGGLYCFDTETGKRHWRIELGAPVNTSPAVGRDAVYLAAFDGAVHALGWPGETEG